MWTSFLLAMLTRIIGSKSSAFAMAVPRRFFLALAIICSFVVTTSNPCRLKRSMQHLLAVYSQEFEIPESFLDVDSSAARPGRAALERWETSPFLAGSIAAAANLYFRLCHAARDFADRKSRPAHP